jgi:hypothetical protein
MACMTRGGEGCTVVHDERCYNWSGGEMFEVVYVGNQNWWELRLCQNSWGEKGVSELVR